MRNSASWRIWCGLGYLVVHERHDSISRANVLFSFLTFDESITGPYMMSNERCRCFESSTSECAALRSNYLIYEYAEQWLQRTLANRSEKHWRITNDRNDERRTDTEGA